jgi:8-amino-7-oxononanoate synthase
MAERKLSGWKKFFTTQIKKAKTQNRERALPVFDVPEPGIVIQDGKRIVNLSSNDYLGLAKDPQTLEEAKVLGEILPIGAGASRLITGSMTIHNELDKLLASWKGTEKALVFASGFQMNIGVLSTILGKGDTVFCDKLNHASIIDGCMISGAEFIRYKHKDVKELEALLKQSKSSKKMIVTDGLFSMDGDFAPLEQLNALAKTYGALLAVDEAHATGIMGENGAGCWSHSGLKVEDHVLLLGTLSKAVGAQGGYVCASESVIHYLVNYCRPFIFSTGISPLLAGLAHFNIVRIQDDEFLRNSLLENINTLRDALKEHGFALPDEYSPIFPVKIGDSKLAVACANALKRKGFITAAIRPPTVREGTARLRLSVSAAHHADDLKQAVEHIAEFIHNHVT